MIRYTFNGACRAPHLQRGLSLIELMVSLTIGLIMLVALTTVFVNQNQARAALDRANRLVENGRYAMEVLSESVRLAGFYGELDPSSLAVPASVPDPCSAIASDIASALRLHVQGYNNSGTTTIKPSCVTAIQPGTDVLVIRRADTGSPVAPSTLTGTITPYLQASLCAYDSSSYQLSSTISNFTNVATTLHKKDCTSSTTGTAADVRPFRVYIYFIAPESSAGDGVPTLKRMELAVAASTIVWTTTALVEGVQNMQIDYGLDTDSDGAPDSYTDCAACTAAQWANVVAVRFNLLARNQDTTPRYSDSKTYVLGSAGTVGPFDDSYKRRAYNQFVRITNPASRREAP